MQYTAKMKQFISDSILCFIRAKDSTEADIRRTIISFMNRDRGFFTDAQIEEFEDVLNEVYHGAGADNGIIQ